MIFYLLQIVTSLIAYYYYRHNIIRYLGIVTTIYFFVYFWAASFDVPLTLYLGFILLGCGIPKRIDSKYILIGCGIAIYALVGFALQDFVLSMSTLITRYSYVLVYIVIISLSSSAKKWKATAADYRFLVILGFITEILMIVLVWMRHGIGARVVTNHQPIGAGIVIAYTMIIGWCYLTKRFSAWEMIIYNILSIVIVILSGTRGYMVIIVLPLMITFIAYFLDIPDNGKNMNLRIGLVCILMAFVTVWILSSDVINVLIEMLRLDEGLGYRENENTFVKKIIASAPIYNKIFGFGFGGNASHLDGFINIVHEASWNRAFMAVSLLTRTIFHNYWYTVLFKQGFFGLIVMFLFYISMMLDVKQLKKDMWTKLLIYTTIIGNAVSITFHITATCSIFEYLILAFFIMSLNADESECINKEAG